MIDIQVRRIGAGTVAISITESKDPSCVHHFIGGLADSNNWQTLTCKKCGAVLRVNDWLDPAEYEKYGITNHKAVGHVNPNGKYFKKQNKSCQRRLTL